MIQYVCEVTNNNMTLPRSPSSSSVVDGKTMLWGRSGGLVAVGLVLSLLDGAYEKHLVGGDRGVLCGEVLKQ